MKLLSVELRGEYKGLKDQQFYFKNSEDGLVALVGLNGSGKSLLMELIAETFSYLERCTRSDFSGKNPLPFGVRIEYEIGSNQLNKRNIIINIDCSGEVAVSGDCEGRLTEDILPDYVVGYSSGLNENLQRAFIKNSVQFYEVQRVKSLRNKELEKKNDFEDISIINKKYLTKYPGIFGGGQIDDDILLSLPERSTPSSKMVYLDYDNLGFLIFSLALIGDNEGEFLGDGARMRKVKRVALRFDLNGGLVEEGGVKDIKMLVDAAGDGAVKYTGKRTSDEQFELYEMDYLAGVITLDLTNESVRSSLSQKNYERPDALFSRLLKLQTLSVKKWPAYSRKNLKKGGFMGTVKKPLKIQSPLMIEELTLEDDAGRDVSLDDVSDGEVQLIQMVAAARIFGSREALILLDEPETHLNPAWRVYFHRLIKSASESVGIDSANIFVSTHSPFMISSLRRESVVFFQRLEDGRVSAMVPDSETYGTSFEVLVKKYFGLRSLISQSAIEEVKNKIEKDFYSDRAGILNWVEETLGESMEKAYLIKRLK